jgi:hypothetical protein
MENKILNIKLTGWDHNNLRNQTDMFKEPRFAFTTRPTMGAVRCKVNIVYCRESFCEYLRQDLRGISDYKIVKTKLHMVAHRRVAKSKLYERNRKVFKEQVLAAQAMANAIEKQYGWPLTKIYECNAPNDLPENNMFFYIAASKRWQKAPAMLSLYTLLFRIASNNGKFKFRTRIKDTKTLYEALDNAAAASNYSELSYYRTHGSFWPLVLENYNKLFGSRTMKNLYQPSKDNYYFSEGINRLCDLDSNDKKLNRAFSAVVKKARSHLL